jgi:hypothetical protein
MVVLPLESKDLSMTKLTDNANRMARKQQLADKCYRLAKLTLSKPRQKSLLHHAKKYSIQARQLAEEGRQLAAGK